MTDNASSQSNIPLAPEPQLPPFPLAPLDPQPLPTPASPPETPLEISPTSPATSDNLSNIPGEIIIKQFKFKGNTVFSDQTLLTITAPYLGRPIYVR